MRKIAHWTEEYSSSESIDILKSLALAHAEAAGPGGARIKSLIRRDDLRGLVEFELDYNDFGPGGQSVESAYHQRQALAFFSKLESLDVGFDKEQAALDAFNSAEHLCFDTNNIFRLRKQGKFCFSPAVESQLFVAQRKISKVLGAFPSFEQLGYRFGKGATTLTKKRMASVREKFAAGVACSAELFPAAVPLLRELPVLCEGWASCLVKTDEEDWYSIPVVINDGKLEFAKKNAKTYRATVTEPPLNGLYQLALGDEMVLRLGAFGLDLKDQTRNQRLAREGSLTGALATLDLKSASDCEAIELVYDLLPLDWAVGLGRARTGAIQYRGQRLVLEKFSSMGNGFTFPLESLIFWALASAVCEPGEVVSVYGDDIIIPSKRYEALVELLTAVGFIPNLKKSYATGPFRESCGADFLLGVNIRPYYQKEWVSARSLFTLHNFYKRRGLDDFASHVLDTFIHPSLHIFGPEGYGDGHLLGDYPRKRKERHTRSGYAGYFFDTFTVKARKDTRPALPTDFVLPSYSVYHRSAAEVLPDFLCKPDEAKRNAKFLAAFQRGFSSLVDNVAIPDHKFEDGEVVKAVAFPLSDEDGGYKRLTIYTLG
ncbi:TPA_asm: RNA-directed RNA polymerase [ssRNA phage SRR7976299_9]|uniref:RNA-directed RNA polymerase n=1 Tax=ssRNA phage SRR7976299_9 TaxID=2786649 RepID=A0A8S5L1S9_9VIRU|nr:RNA-directed RNA polymerase [ssRNA phage SRR7976299_9]DAD51066.1 TPA_asm: RNA-directed RNA polymerase [ssRNA phage SRR7976299_9]